MKALILSGGKGTRLRPITHTGAKQLVPVANKPILFYAIENIVAAGITDIGIIVGDTHKEIRAAVGDGSAFGAKVTYIQQEAPLGLAHAVKISEEFMAGDSFVMFLGDNLIKDGITKLVNQFRDSGVNSQILLAHVPNPTSFGVAEVKGDRIVRLVEKPKVPPSDLALVGVYMFDNNIFKAVNAIKPSARGELEITDAIQYLIDEKYDVASFIIEGWWKDTGKLEDMLESNRMMLDSVKPCVAGTVDRDTEIDGRVVVGKGTVVTGSRLRGPAIIGENCVIKDSYIGPYSSVNNGCKVINSEVEHSIILEHSEISIGARLEDSLIGKNVKISESDIKPKAYRFMVGDNSEVSII